RLRHAVRAQPRRTRSVSNARSGTWSPAGTTNAWIASPSPVSARIIRLPSGTLVDIKRWPLTRTNRRGFQFRWRRPGVDRGPDRQVGLSPMYVIIFDPLAKGGVAAYSTPSSPASRLAVVEAPAFRSAATVDPSVAPLSDATAVRWTASICGSYSTTSRLSNWSGVSTSTPSVWTRSFGKSLVFAVHNTVASAARMRPGRGGPPP